MCDFCNEEMNGKTLLTEDELVRTWSLWWGLSGGDEGQTITVDKKLLKESQYELSLFIDRGYLRLVDIEDSGCLDHGAKIKIKYCPMCGRNFEQSNVEERIESMKSTVAKMKKIGM